MQRYPESTLATLEDFRQCRWKAAVGAATPIRYASIWQELSKAAHAALNEGKLPESKVLWLMADACSMMLRTKSINEPFAPFTVFENRRSATPEDFQDADVALLAEIASELDDAWVRARIADLVWLRRHTPRSVTHALIAIDAYREIPLNSDTWANGSRDCWDRAFTLAIQLGAGAGSRLAEMEAALLAKLNQDAAAEGFFFLSISRILFENNLCRSHRRHIAELLATRGQALASGGAQYNARSYLEAAAQWYGRLNERELQADMVCAVAEAWASEAIARASGDEPSHTVAVTFYEKSIQAYKGVPRSLRAARRVDERIAELHKKLEAAGTASLNEMSRFSTPSIDISEMVEEARASVRNKPAMDALHALANVAPGVKKRKIEETAEMMLRDYPLQAIFATTMMSRDGRVIARRPGIGERGSDDYRLTVWAEMVKHYNMEISLTVQAQIWPALQAFLLEHRVREADLAQLASQSPIIPQGRETLVGKALFAGFEQDLVTSLHLLVPQVEHLARWHLKAAGVKTTTLSSEGIENENGLSTLVDVPEFVAIFGEDLAFELKALFCDPFGANLRNEVAHGLLDAGSCQSAQTVYAWWLLLRMTFNTFWNSKRVPNGEPSAASDVPPPADEAQ